VNKTFISLLLALLLTACASGVKLNEVPVVDKKASSVSNGASSSGLSDINPSASSSSQQVQQPKSTSNPSIPWPTKMRLLILRILKKLFTSITTVSSSSLNFSQPLKLMPSI